MSFDHRWQYRLAAEEHALQHHGHISITRGLLDLEHVIAIGDRGVVDQHVDGAETRGDLADHRGDVGADADVSPDCDRVTGGLRDLTGAFSRAISMPVDDRDPGAL